MRAEILKHAVNEQKLTKELEKANRKISGFTNNASQMKAKIKDREEEVKKLRGQLAICK